jgi:hypothetical protein
VSLYAVEQYLKISLLLWFFFFCERMVISLILDNSTSPTYINTLETKEKSKKVHGGLLCKSTLLPRHSPIAAMMRRSRSHRSPPATAFSCCHHQREPTHVETQKPMAQNHARPHLSR